MNGVEVCARGRRFGLIAAALLACAPGAAAAAASRVLTVSTADGARYAGGHYPPLPLADHEVVLTFDDGPEPDVTPKILTALRAHRVHATFFMIGAKAERAASTARAVARAGHTIGSHTSSHANFGDLGAAAQVREIDLGIAQIRRALGPHDLSPLFRFVQLRDTPESLAHLTAVSVAPLDVDIDSEDWRGDPPAVTKARLLERLARLRKGVILLHDAQPNTAALLPDLLRTLDAEGYRIVELRTH